MRKLNYRHYICIALTVIFVLLAVFMFGKNAFQRLIESGKDFGTSCVFYVEEIFADKHTTDATVKEFSKVPFEMPFGLPDTWDEFVTLWHKYWETLFTQQNFKAFWHTFTHFMYNASQVLLIAMPVILLLVIVSRLGTGKINNEYNKDTKALVRWKKFTKKVYAPTKKWIKEFIAFVKENKYYFKIWCWTWAFNFNVIAIVIECIAFYLYLVTSFDLINIYVQVLKLLRDCSTAIKYVPTVIWLVLGLSIFHSIRKKRGYAMLEHLERKNRGFLNERAFITLWCGTIGKGKTTGATSAGLSWEIMFRDKAFELLLQTDLKFPYFPWINLELSLKKAMAKHSVYNLASCRRFARSKAKAFSKRPCKQRIFMYDYERYGITHNDGLKEIDVWQAIEDYCQLYFIYIVYSSLMLSNYSVRSDNVKLDEGNLPLWDTELFRRNPKLMKAYSRHSHILDFDSLRIGKKVIEHNKYANSFEFGVVLITEIGKERGNMLENKGKKKDDNEANQLNDLFNSQLKMLRHSATVCNYCFVRLIADEQRPESWGADAKELADIIFIKKKNDMRLAMPFFEFEDLVIDWFVNKYTKWYTNYRFEHGDNTLWMYIYKSVIRVLFNYRLRIYNTFGYQRMVLQVVEGRNENLIEEKAYYIIYKKDYSLRFASDAYSDVWASKALKARFGIDDLPAYKDTKASVEEFRQQNSYFMNELLNDLLSDDD